MKQSIVICKNLARHNNYHFDVTFGFRDVNAELRFPDWVASARKKVPPENLKKYKHFIILKNRLAPQYLLRVLKKVSL
ncbi:MAG: hypothetical protein ACE5IO_08675 [Thermoplasmata archaeon]